MQNKFTIAANWKMNGSKEFVQMVLDRKEELQVKHSQVILFPPSLYLSYFEGKEIAYGAQDCDHREKGAHTGQISAEMIKDIGASYVLLGHSERRQAGESSEIVKQKMQIAVTKGLHPVVCVGESEADKKAGHTLAVLKEQIEASVDFDCPFTIAYEPVWAIGTGLTPEFFEVNAIHKWIRSEVSHFTKKKIDILYGGSVNKGNIEDIKACSDIDGVLIGGASLDIDHFMEIIVRSK